jgi:NDP-sugar pyrophosphorylase family protein
LQTESSTHTIVVKESLSGETDDEDDEYQAEDRSSDFNSTAIVVLPNKKNEIFESTTLPKLVKNKELMAFKHNGFWQCMDNIREKVILEKIWNTKKAPWKIW